MLENLGGNYYNNSKSVDVCKRDYEADIKRERTQCMKITTLINAMWDLVGYNRLDEKMAELIGELVSWQRQSTHSIENLITAQEKEENKK